MAEWVLSVSELNEYVRRQLAGDPVLRAVSVRGEISGFKNHFSGHKYFVLKDRDSRVNCVMFRQHAMNLNFLPQDGMQVTIRGAASLYAQTGAFQVYVEAMEKEGVGDLYLRFEALKEKLAGEGLFDPALKKPLPMIPRTVGVVTALSGAAIHDIIRVARNRNPRVNILLAPVSVQGAQAAGEIAKAILKMNEMGRADVLLVGRGGGSLEDLWAFNEEIVARAIAASRIPVVSCVGHEVDFTIADFVADVRAATPSNAAEIAVPVIAEMKEALQGQMRRGRNALNGQQALRRARLRALGTSGALGMPERILTEPRRAELTMGIARIQHASAHARTAARARLHELGHALAALNPQNVLERGYALVEKDGRIVSSAAQLNPGERALVTMRDGRVPVCVDSGKDNRNE